MYLYWKSNYVKNWFCVDFVTVSTSHNLIEMVCEEVESEHVPSSMVCNIHPLMMMQHKVKQIFQVIHDKIGNNKIKNCFFYIDVDLKSEYFPIKAIRCVTFFINRDFSTKSWNHQKHFDAFIHLKNNESLSLKGHRFNCIFEWCCSLVHHMDDIKSYLEKFSSAVKEWSIVDCSYLVVEVLKPMFLCN